MAGILQGRDQKIHSVGMNKRIMFVRAWWVAHWQQFGASVRGGGGVIGIMSKSSTCPPPRPGGLGMGHPSSSSLRFCEVIIKFMSYGNGGGEICSFILWLTRSRRRVWCNLAECVWLRFSVPRRKHRVRRSHARRSMRDGPFDCCCSATSQELPLGHSVHTQHS